MDNSKFNEYITNNYEKLSMISKSISNERNDYEDVLHEAILAVYELNDEKKTEIYPYLEFYLIQVMKYSFYSKNSSYHRKYKMLETDNNIIHLDDYELDSIIEDIDEPVSDITMADVEKVLKDVDWYSREVFLRHLNDGKSFNKLSKETGIPASSLFNTYKTVKLKIIEALNGKYEQKTKEI